MAKFPDKFQSIFETAIDGVIVINKRGIIEDANLASVLLFGYTKEEMIGNNVSMLMAEPHHSAHDSYLHAYQKTKNYRNWKRGRR